MLRTDHVVFPVWDAEASLVFYRDVMGFALVECVSGGSAAAR
ncbi:MAG: VOC family protein [Rhizomicrobium sp.]|jgi:catechol 2,3-dioxygenase-like lactoylglutathione lyase family enzyme